MAVFDWRRGRIFGVNVVDLLIVLGAVGLLYFSANRERYFESMKGDVEGITGDYFALVQKGYGLSVVVKGYGMEISGRVVDAERDRLFVFDGERVLTICSDRDACDVVPLVIRAYAVPERRTVSGINVGSLGALAGKQNVFLTFSVYLQDSPAHPLALSDGLAGKTSGSVDVAELNYSLRLTFRNALPSDIPAIESALSGQKFSLSPVLVVGVA